MLVLTRRVGERIEIDGGITVTVTHIGADLVKLGFEAPRHINIRREEVPDNRDRGNDAEDAT